MTRTSSQDLLRRLPSVDALLQADAVREALARHPRSLVLDSIRQVLETTRKHLLEGGPDPDLRDLEPAVLVQSILEQIEVASNFTLRSAVNATGIIVHTNLGRSLLPEEALDRIRMICRTYNNLEYNLELGRRGSRYVHAESVLCELTGAQSALVVNNNAGAVFLVLNTLAKDMEVIVSRGQLVEIGGSFRIPDVMRASGAILREVGCTNRTHPQDFVSAIGDRTALLMKVHTSNYRIIGFTAEVTLEEMVSVGKAHGLPVVEDLGSGSLIDLSKYGLAGEPTVQDSVRNGADIVTFSGDKLLGGPQAGIILGKQELVDRCKKNPITRALRVDKLTLAALEATLRLYRDHYEAFERIPTLRMISLSQDVLNEKAQELSSLIRRIDTEQRLAVEVRSNYSQVGGGSLPAQNLPTFVVAVNGPGISAQKIENLLRKNDPPIIGRIESDQFLMDTRTLLPDDLQTIGDAFARLLCNFVSNAPPK
jgi:L-seryl-tRNA(Ser) seleniumtransferase